MTPEQLRASILQYAMEGKLVKQDPNEEPASVLLEKIKNKKDQLVKEKKIKKTSTLPEVTEDEKPFDIPDSWEWVKLGDVLFNLDGKRIPVSVKDREKRVKIYDYYGASGVIDKIDSYLFSKPLLLISEDGANLLARSKPIAFIAKGKYWVNNHAHVLDGYNLENLNFISWYIESINISKFVTGTAQPKLNQKNMNNIALAFPPLAEQKRIVAKIEKLMPLIDEYAKAYNRLKSIDDGFNDKMKQSILQYAMEGKMVKQAPDDEPASELLKKIKNEKIQLIKEKKIKRSKRLPEITDDEKKFDIPNSWEWVRLGEIGAITSGGTPKTTEKSYWEKAKIPWITPAVMSSQINGIVFQNTEIKYINKNGLEHSSAQLIPAYSIVVSSRAPIGYVNIVPYEYTTNQGCKSVTTFSNVNKEFIYYTIKYSVPDMYKRASGTTFKEISGTKFGQTIIPLPPLNEQKRIVTKIKELMSLIE
ncbi:restriction endonuclease subunit S [Limosilactobacillus reuteri]|uniref:restriction endonuclease subunit S n=1 Tax=Limosilactobacillus reuteri TaxID=1598 RepID=UPI000A1E11C1|nr:restriction endonuclease subunit S [Limosilactobacillus reuteri]